MKRRFFLATIFVFAGVVTSLADTDAEVNARKNALDVAGAFTNDGFKLRDGHWCGTLKAQDHALIAVNIYDETGRLLTTEHYEGGDRAAAGFSPNDSGQYFVSVDLVDGGSSSFCLIYSYK